MVLQLRLNCRKIFYHTKYRLRKAFLIFNSSLIQCRQYREKSILEQYNAKRFVKQKKYSFLSQFSQLRHHVSLPVAKYKKNI